MTLLYLFALVYLVFLVLLAMVYNNRSVIEIYQSRIGFLDILLYSFLGFIVVSFITSVFITFLN